MFNKVVLKFIMIFHESLKDLMIQLQLTSVIEYAQSRSLKSLRLYTNL